MCIVQSYYRSGDEASFSSSQARGWLTDLEMMGKEGVGDMEMWGSIVVHKAVVAPLCPYLARLCC